MSFRVKIRITSDSAEDAEHARDYLLKRLPGLSLATARKGNNPKYADNPQVLAYGDLDVPIGREKAPTRRRRKTTAPVQAA